MRLKTMVVAAVACLAIAVPSSATAASSPTQDAYSGVAGQQQGGSQGAPSGENAQSTGAEPEVTSSASLTPTSSSGTLPFTGLEMALIALVAVGLLGGGIFLFRKSRHGAQPLG
jgi:cobalamin biosynthesis Mg chelatase CobN